MPRARVAIVALIIAAFVLARGRHAAACTTSVVTVQLSWDAGLFEGTAVQVQLSYNPALVDIPGFSTQPSVVSRVTNLSGISGLFGVSDIPSGDPPVDRTVTIGLVASVPLLPGPLARVSFDCRGSQTPSTADFGCWVELVSADGSTVPSTSCAVAVTAQ